MTSSTSKAAAFRAIAQARRSVKRFQENRAIPKETIQDMLESTMVRRRVSPLLVGVSVRLPACANTNH